jgi:formamidopyrimidine-DNA glycosylase
MGLEPWDSSLTKDYLLHKYSHKKTPIKTVLLDQSIIVGIGNIYADEILFLSHINPLRSANSLTEKELNSIINNTKEVLEKAIKKGGTTIRSYTSVNGVHGLFQQELSVHTKQGQPCPICQTVIIKTKVGGRGTYYCSHCQK